MQDSIFDRARPYRTRSYIEDMFSCPGSHWSNGEFWCLNPTRDDRSVGSFSIREDGKWFDNATASGGDVFDLVAHMTNTTPVEVARLMIGDDMSGSSQVSDGSIDTGLIPAKADKKAMPDWRPIPSDRMPHFHTQPSNLTLYYDGETGKPQYYVVRYNKTEKLRKKVIYPIYWSGSRYIISLPPNLIERTLIPFDRSKPVVLLEGERKTEIAKSHDKSLLYSYTCWHGGSGQADRIDLRPLAGCNVILFPDNDDASVNCYRKIAKRLGPIAASVKYIKPSPDLRKGYDIADFIEEQRDVFVVLASATDWLFSESEKLVAIEAEPTNYTDLGNAERFVAMYKNSIKYNTDKNKWMVWNGKFWSDDDQSSITPMVKRTIRSIEEDNPNDGAAKAHSLRSESSGSISSMLFLATKEVGIPVREDQLDSVPNIVVAENGSIDLRTGSIIEPSRDHLCSKTMAIPYDKEAKAPRFMKFLDEIMLGDAEKIEFLQRWFGYSLTADTSAQSFLIMYGTGANGKSTLVELISRISGGYAKSAPPDTFTLKQAGGIPNDIAALRGSRLVLTTETEANARLAESKVKYMTGGDRVSARFMRGEFFEFVPQWKIVISTNHRPRVSGGDFGIWRRVLLLPFKFQADGSNLDPLLPQKLWEEREGVLAWMVDGARKWYLDGMGRTGLAIPKSILVETQEYRVDDDLIGRYVADECLTGLDLPYAHGEIESSALFKSFREWADGEGERFYAQMTQTMFGRAMRERGFESTRGKGGRKVYKGIYPKLGMTISEQMGGK